MLRASAVLKRAISVGSECPGNIHGAWNVALVVSRRIHVDLDQPYLRIVQMLSALLNGQQHITVAVPCERILISGILL
jgi:hypothetical protein